MGIPKQDEHLQASSHRQSPYSQANLLSLLQYPRHVAVVRGHLCRVMVQMISTHKTPMAAPSDQTPLLLKSTCDTNSLWYLKVSKWAYVDSPLNDPLLAIFRRPYRKNYCFATSLSKDSYWPIAAPHDRQQSARSRHYKTTKIFGCFCDVGDIAAALKRCSRAV